MREQSLRSTPLAGLAVLVGLLVLGACSSITETQQNLVKYGAVNFAGKRTASGQVSASATVVAFESAPLLVPNSTLRQNEQCQYAAVDTTTPRVRGDRSAGDAVSITVAGTTRQLPYSATEIRYDSPIATPFVYGSGDVAQVTIPGNGSSFPALSGSLKLAEPLELGPLVLPPDGENLTVTWNGTNDPTAAIILQIKYPNPIGTAFANEQVYCALQDDGLVVLPGGLLDPLQNATSKRSLTLVRWRTNFVSTNGANLHLTSSTDTTVVFP